MRYRVVFALCAPAAFFVATAQPGGKVVRSVEPEEHA